MNEKWMLLSLEEIEKKLNTNAASGLTRKAARSRRQKAGENAFFLLPRAKIVDCLCQVIKQPAPLVLLLLATLLLLFEPSLGRGLLMQMVLIVAALTTVRLISSKMLAKKARLLLPYVHVIREGQMYLLPDTQLVAGDVIELMRGDTVPCDARLISSEALRVLTYTGKGWGRDAYVRTLKNAAHTCTREHQNDITRHDNMLYGGSVIEQGTARAVVVETGKHTYIGALQGGMVLSTALTLPQRTQRIRHIAARAQIVLLLSILPLLCLCLLFGRYDAGIPTLFGVLTCLCLANLCGATDTLLEFALIYSRTRHTDAVMRPSFDADALLDADYLLMFDAHALSDDLPHICDIHMPRQDGVHADVRALLTAVVRYERARAMLPGDATTHVMPLTASVTEYVRQHRLEPLATIGQIDHVSQIDAHTITFDHDGARSSVSLYTDAAQLGSMLYLRVRDGVRRMDEATQRTLQQFAAHTAQQGNTICAVCTREGNARVLEGVLALSRADLPTIERRLAQLRAAGITPLLFLPAQTRAGAAYAMRVHMADGPEEIAVASQFRQQDRSVLSDLGKYHVYLGFSGEELRTLVQYLRTQKKRVVAVCGAAYGAQAWREADVRLAVAETDIAARHVGQPLIRRVGQRGGEAHLRREAHAWLPLVHERGGGLETLCDMMLRLDSFHRNVEDAVQYLLFSQTVRMVLTIPLLCAGIVSLSPSQLMFSGLLFDLPAVLWLLTRLRRRETARAPRTVGAGTTAIRAICSAGLTLSAFLFIYHNAPDDVAARSALCVAMLLMQMVAWMTRLERGRVGRYRAAVGVGLLVMSTLVLAVLGVLQQLALVPPTVPYLYLTLLAPLSVLLSALVVWLYRIGHSRGTEDL